jgi:hypothetical protein
VSRITITVNERAVRAFKVLHLARREAIDSVSSHFGIPVDKIEPVFDLHMAPRYTDRKRLELIGIALPESCPQVSDDEKAALAATIIEGLAMWHIFIYDTDHLTDSALAERLFKAIDANETPCVPPMFKVASFLSMRTKEDGESPAPVTERDIHLPITPMHVRGHAEY